MRLKNRSYSILIPTRIPETLYAYPNDSKSDFGHFLDGDRPAMECIRNAAATLALDRDAIIFLPLKHHKAIYPLKAPWEPDYNSYDIVFYNHQIQLNRSVWGTLRNMIAYTKGENITVPVNIGALTAEAEKAYQIYQKTYWYTPETKKTRIHSAFNTLFVESCVREQLVAFLDMQRFLETDIEHYLSPEVPATEYRPEWVEPYEGIFSTFMTAEVMKKICSR